MGREREGLEVWTGLGCEEGREEEGEEEEEEGEESGGGGMFDFFSLSLSFSLSFSFIFSFLSLSPILTTGHLATFSHAVLNSDFSKKHV